MQVEPAVHVSFRARIHLLPVSAGGRSSPLRTGYRSLLRFKGSELDRGFELELDPEWAEEGLAPGSTGSARLASWAIEDASLLRHGQEFEIREGAKRIGTGTIIE